MIKIATIEDEENIRQEIVRYIKKGIGSIEGVEVDVYESAERRSEEHTSELQSH